MGKNTYSKGYLRYALGLMFMVTVFNYTDRFVLSILIDPIQKDLGFTDSQIGLLTGIAFAVVYSFMAIPIGRLADRFNRVRIVAIAVMVWSGFTAIFGMASNYTHMILARIGVAAGEAGGINPIYSIIGDYYPAEKRGTAVSIITLGGSVGTMIGFALAGGMLFNLLYQKDQRWGLWTPAFDIFVLKVCLRSCSRCGPKPASLQAFLNNLWI